MIGPLKTMGFRTVARKQPYGNYRCTFGWIASESRATRNVWSAALLPVKNEKNRFGLRECIRLLSEENPPGQNGMRGALFPFK
jgi:hypothetical protein